MQKLEEILLAEEEARNIVIAAQARADAILREASVLAREAAEKTRAEAESSGRELRESRLAEARVQAETIDAAASEVLSKELGRADERMPQIVATIARELVG